jgi:hypothetical protein
MSRPVDALQTEHDYSSRAPAPANNQPKLIPEALLGDRGSMPRSHAADWQYLRSGRYGYCPQDCHTH